MSIGKIFAMLGLAAIVWSCQGKTKTPDHLLGIWKTTSSGYDQEFMNLSKEAIIFGNEQGESRGYSIYKVVEQSERSRLLYIVTYKDVSSTEYQLAFYYEPTAGGTITFKNQPHLSWIRTGASHDTV